MRGFKSSVLGILPLLFLIVELRATPTSWYTSRSTKLDWNTDKLGVLLNTVKDIIEHTGDDITIVASQNIHNEDGTLKEIKTIELIIPSPHAWRSRDLEKPNYLEKLKNYDDDFDDVLVKTQNAFKIMQETTGIKRELAYKRMLTGGATDLEIFVNKDEVFVQEAGDIGYYIRDNIRTDNKKKVEEDITKRFENRSNDTLLTVLLWNENGKFLSDESKVDPTLLAYVDGASDSADENMMNSALEALSKSALNHPERIAKELSAAMSNAHPKYRWFVTKLQGENAENVNYDMFIKVTYDNVRPGESPSIYTIYGVKK